MADFKQAQNKPAANAPAGDSNIAGKQNENVWREGGRVGPDGKVTGGKIRRTTQQYKGGFAGAETGDMSQFLLDESLGDANNGTYKTAMDERLAKLQAGGTPEGYKNVQAAQAGQSDFRDNQKQLADLLYQQAIGQGPSAAQSTLQLANDKAINAQMSMARSGGNPAAMRQAMFNAATLTQQNAGEAATLRANEMMAGRQLYANQLQGARGLDDNMSQFNAGQTNQVNTADAANFNNAVAQKEAAVQKYIAMGYDQANADRAANMDIARINMGALRADEAFRIGAANKLGDFATDLVTGGFKTVAGATGKALGL